MKWLTNKEIKKSGYYLLADYPNSDLTQSKVCIVSLMKDDEDLNANMVSLFEPYISAPLSEMKYHLFLGPLKHPKNRENI